MRSRAPNPKGSARYTLAVHGDTGVQSAVTLRLELDRPGEPGT